MTTETVSPLRQRMIEDMNARKLGAHTQRGHIYSCKRFAAFLKRSPDTATAEDIRRFQVHLADTGMSICNRNRIMTGVRFLFRVTLRRLDLAAEIYHMREPEKLPLVMSKDEMKRLLAVAGSLKARIMLSLGYGCGLRASEVVRLKVKHIDTAQKVNHAHGPSFWRPINPNQSSARRPLGTINEQDLRLRVQIPIEPAVPPGAPPTAISCLGAFRTPAASACRSPSTAGVRKPDQYLP